MIYISSIHQDNVINSKFLTGHTTYKFAVEKLYPLINRLDIQRSLQNPSFYKRLKEDLLRGCIMPPITIALIHNNNEKLKDIVSAKKFIEENINEMFILDGIQRLNTLHNASTNPELEISLDAARPLFLNILICNSMDNLLYRMITLNNGQKPMSANHQIEILLGNVYDFDELGINLITDKEKRQQKTKRKNVFEKSSIIKGYLAFLTDSVSIDNKKIIDSKMDALISKKIMDSNITKSEVEFSNVISVINNLSENNYIKKWLDNANNLIGFCVGIKKSFSYFTDIPISDFAKSLEVFEKTFKSLNISSIKLSKERRNLSRYYISHYKKMHMMDEIELLDVLNENIL